MSPMKKLLFPLLLALLGVSPSAFGQGNVVFNNFSPNTNFRIWTNNTTLTASNLMSPSAGIYTFGLYVGAVSTPEGSLELVGTVGNGGLQPGYFSGANPFQLPAPYGPGTPINFQIRAWSAWAGANWNEALATSAANPSSVALGQSTIGTVTPGSTPPAPLFGTTAGLLSRGFEVSLPIPEPSSIALGLLGVGAMVLFRRRK
jgi:hypothetical protein